MHIFNYRSQTYEKDYMQHLRYTNRAIVYL